NFNPNPPLSVSHTAVLRTYTSGLPTYPHLMQLVPGCLLLSRGCSKTNLQDAWHTFTPSRLDSSHFWMSLLSPSILHVQALDRKRAKRSTCFDTGYTWASTERSACRLGGVCNALYRL
ncbi:unnamed protein product, partial [Ectocarpus sp. 4 AP-2014]